MWLFYRLAYTYANHYNSYQFSAFAWMCGWGNIGNMWTRHMRAYADMCAHTEPCEKQMPSSVHVSSALADMKQRCEKVLL